MAAAAPIRAFGRSRGTGGDRGLDGLGRSAASESKSQLKLFSGGNQQKVVLAKWLRTKPRVLLLDEPTQGVDVGAKAAIYELIVAAAKAGTGVLVCSSDTKELVSLCDRVLVFEQGRILEEIDRQDLTESRLVRSELGLGTDSSMNLATAEGPRVS